jgi:hypothetical protein
MTGAKNHRRRPGMAFKKPCKTFRFLYPRDAAALSAERRAAL